MPLIRGQPFTKLEPPPGLRDDDEVFLCKITGEIFRDYEKYFERTILCNSLVWSCEMTGRSGLTFEEAIESERRARIPIALQRPILYLASLTKRSRLSELNDDVYGFIKERYFTREIVEVIVGGQRRKCRVIKVVSPALSKQQNGKTESNESSDDSDSIICLDDIIEEAGSIAKSEEHHIKPEKYEYVVQDLKNDTIYMIKGNSVSRKRTAYTREKSRLFLKQHCAHDQSGFWKVKDIYMTKFKLFSVNISEFFDGPKPVFTASKPRKRNRSSGVGSSEEDRAIKRAKKEFREKKKMESNERRKLKNNSKAVKKEKMKEVNMLSNNSGFNAEEQKFSLEERLALREEIKAKKLAERIAHHLEMKKKKEEEKQKKKEERDKEREKRREEKLLRDAYLREWNKPRDDLECDDLKDLPLPTPVQTCVPIELFGDVVMVLEYLHSFGELIDYSSQFPNGISLTDLGKALMSAEVDGLFYDLLRLFLSTLFQLQRDEEEDEENSSIKDFGHAEDDEESVNGTAAAYQLPQLSYSTSLRDLPVDSFTISEVLRLHFLASGTKASEANARFRYQQRGVYTSSDDAGLEFRKSEIGILKELAQCNVFDLEAAEKLKILRALIHQVLTYVASRDIIEDSCEQLKQVSYELRHHRWAEQRREKEEAAFWYRKRLEEKARERELEQQRKEEKKKARQEKHPQQEDINKDDQSETLDESPNSSVADRPITRQAEQLTAKQDGEFFETPVENIQWDKITPADRIRMKEKYANKELELLKKVIELQHKISISPLGRDRTFRRYWMFQSLPGLFVEDLEEYVPDDFFAATTQVSDRLINDGKTALEEKSTSSDKENDSFDLNKSSAPLTPTLPVMDSIKPLTENISNKADVINSALVQQEVPPKHVSVFQQIAQRNQVRWAFFNADQLDSLISSLNGRGFREGALKATLKEQRTFLLDHIKNMRPNEIHLAKGDVASQRTQLKYQNVRLKKKKTQGSVQNTSAQEFLELNLREMLLDIEERIYVGSLGAIKVTDREKWRAAIEFGSYDSQNGKARPQYVHLLNGSVGGDGDDYSSGPAVHDLAEALIQIEQGVDKKYLTQPLGEAERSRKLKPKPAAEVAIKSSKKKEDVSQSGHDNEDGDKQQKSALERWEESLVQSTGFPQVFLHLGLLESSIAWSKSALHARCRICRRKGDGDKMLLCDGCDRGHHMYCLKPPVKHIPKGDWYCPDCCPKDIPKTPRKQRKAFFEEDDEMEDVNSSAEDADSSSSSSSSDDDSDEDDFTSDTQESSDADSGVSPVVTKVKLVNVKSRKDHSELAGKRLQASQSQADDGKVRITRSTSSGRINTRSSTPNSDVVSTRHSIKGKRKCQSQAESTSGQPEVRRTRQSLPETTAAKTSSTSRHSLDSSKSRAKRRLEQSDQDTLSSTSGTGKSKRRSTGIGYYSKQCEDLIMELHKKKESWPFLVPVNKRDAPDYFDVVKKPMDLSTIKNKINRYEYLNPSEMLEDVRLMLNNCFQYNMPTTAVYLAGLKLSRHFERRIKELHLDTLLGKASSVEDKSPGSSRRSSRH